MVGAIPEKRREVIGGKYLLQYTFSACSTAGAVPLLDTIGVGPATMIGMLFSGWFLIKPLTNDAGVIFCLLAGTLTLITAKFGFSMQMWQ